MTCIYQVKAVVLHSRFDCLQVRNALKGQGKLELHWENTLYHYDDLPFEGMVDMPDVFSPFKNKV